MKTIFLAYTFIIVLFCCSGNVQAQNDTSSISLIDRYSFDELINLKISSAEKHEQNIEDVTANVEILTKHQIELLGYKTLHQILQNITGFYYIEDHYWLGSKNYGVRGYFKNGPFSNVAILINGVNQMSDKYSDFPDVKITLPVEAIERIEIIKGPMAVMYGSSAFFGIINIITVPNQYENKGNSQFSVGTSDQMEKKIAFHLANNMDDFQYKLIIGGRNSPGKNIPYSQMTTNTNLLSYVGLDSTATTKSHLDFEETYFGIQVKYREFKIDLSHNTSKKGVFDASPAYGNGNTLHSDATNMMLEYRHDITSNLEVALALNFYYHNHLLDYSLFHEHYYEIDAQKTNSNFLESHLKWKPKKNLSLLGGINRRTVTDIIQLSDYGYYGLSSGDGKIGLPYDEKYSTYSLYTELQYKPNKRITFYGGLRLEYLQPYDIYYRRGIVTLDSTENNSHSSVTIIESTYIPQNKGITFVPRFAAIFEASENQFLKLLYGEAKKHPSFSENYRQLPDNRPQLNPSSIKTLELNYYTYNVPNFVINASLFYNSLNNIIEATNIYNKESSEWEIYSANSGKLRTHGFEGEIKYIPSNDLNIKLSGTIQTTNNLREHYKDVETAYSPNFLGYLTVMYNLKDKILIGANLRYVGKMETSWIYDPITETGNRLAPATNPYAILDLNLRKEIIHKTNIYINLKINNLLNVNYRYPTTKSNAWIDLGVPGNKRHANISIGLKFK